MKFLDAALSIAFLSLSVYYLVQYLRTDDRLDRIEWLALLAAGGVFAIKAFN